MSNAVSFGTNTNAQRKRVYFTGATAVYEGMPMFYDDSTTNVLGVDRYDSSASTTTTEGYLNEGRFLRVEIPADDNVDRFAGVVAAGPKVGTTGPCWLDIFIPNGAVVPVRTDVACVKDVTILTTASGEEELGTATTSTRPVAIARETLDSTDARLVLAEVCPNKFIYMDSRGTALSLGAGTADRVLNSINIVSAQTSGWCQALSIVFNTVTTSSYSGIYIESGNTGVGTGGFNVINLYGEAAGTVIAADVNGIKAQMNLLAGAGLTSAGIAAGIFAKAEVKAGAGTIAGDVVGGRFAVCSGSAITGDTAMLYFDYTGDAVDYFFKTSSAGAIAQNSDGGTATGTTCGLYLEILVNDVAYWVPTYTAAELAS